MESGSIFPIFGPLHSDDAASTAIPCERPPRNVYPNKSGLFLVTPETISQCAEAEEEAETRPLKVTGDLPSDTIAALHCLAFLMEFFNVADAGDLRKCADEIRGRQ